MEIERKINEIEGEYIIYNVIEKHIISMQLKLIHDNPYTYWAA